MTPPNIEVLDERVNNLMTDIKVMREELENKVTWKVFTYIAGGVSGLAIVLILFLIGQQFTFQKNLSDLSGQVTTINNVLSSIVKNYDLKVDNK